MFKNAINGLLRREPEFEYSNYLNGAEAAIEGQAFNLSTLQKQMAQLQDYDRALRIVAHKTYMSQEHGTRLGYNSRMGGHYYETTHCSLMRHRGCRLTHSGLRINQEFSRGEGISLKIDFSAPEKERYRKEIFRFGKVLERNLGHAKERAVSLAKSGVESAFDKIPETLDEIKSLERTLNEFAKYGEEMPQAFYTMYDRCDKEREVHEIYNTFFETTINEERAKVENFKQKILFKLQAHAESLTRKPKLLDSARETGNGHIVQNVQPRLIPPQGY